MSRTLRFAALLFGMALLAAACGGDDGGSPGTPGAGPGELPECPLDALEGADGPVEVVLWHSYIAKTQSTLEALADEFNASQDEVVINVQSQGQSYNELVNKYNQAIPTNDLPGIVILEDTQTQFIADSGTILPAQACFDATDTDMDVFLPIGVASYTVDDAMQAGSLNLSTPVLYYNRSHFEQAGLDPDDPPQTLEELREVAAALQEAGASEQPLAFNAQAWFVEHMLTGAGQTTVNNDNGREGVATAATLDNEFTLEVFEWVQEMNDEGLMLAVTGDGAIDHYFAVGQGQSSMLIETSTAATTVDAFLAGELEASDLGVDDPGASPEGLEIGVAPVPGLREAGRGQIGGGVWYITTDPTPPEVQAAAWRFLEFMNRPESQVEWNLEGSYLPWVKAAADDPELQEAWEDTRRGRWLGTAYEAILDLNPDFPGPLIGPYVETRAAIGKALEEVILGGRDPQDAIADANAEITRSLERYEQENF